MSRHIRHFAFRLAAFGLGFQALACGPSETETYPSAGVAARWSSPPDLSPVLLGSLEVVSAPPPGNLNGTLLLALLAEPGAKVYYAYHTFAADVPVNELSEYQTPLNLLPPVTIFAVAGVDGKRGEVRSFHFNLAPGVFSISAAEIVRRLTGNGQKPTAIDLSDAAKSLVTTNPAGLSERMAQVITVDGKADDWTGSGRLFVRDAVHDVPPDFGFIDVTSVQTGESDAAFFVAIATREAPKKNGHIAYGCDAGPSNITLDSFGAGADFIYRIQVAGGALQLFTEKDGNSLPLSADSGAAIDEIAELQIAKSDLPAFTDKTDLAWRCFAYDNEPAFAVYDYAQPLFLRSTFTSTSSAATPADAHQVLQILSPPGSSELDVAPAYFALHRTLVPELEAINQIPLYDGGTLPLYQVPKEVNGYAGLNTGDRGVLTTLGAGTSLLTRAQLLAHELAHFQNARSSAVKSRWLQEGMSEWSSERLLYKHFPKRAVHKYLRQLRFDRYFADLSGKPDTFPLEKWGVEVQPTGYEKSLMFFDLLEQELGQGALIKAFQNGVNEMTDGAAFQAFLERETGRDLTDLFKHWMTAGEATPVYDPYTLFQAKDGDELLAIDEKALGTDSKLADTDGDGYLDSEEFYRGRDPLVSSLDSTGALIGEATTRLATTARDPSALLRLGGDPHSVRKFSFDQFAAAPKTLYTLPLFIRPPAAVAVQAVLNGKAGGVQVLNRPLFIGGTETTIAYPAEGILPFAPRMDTSLDPDVKEIPESTTGYPYPSVADAPFDVPDDYAAYDIINTEVKVASNGDLTLEITTRAPPDPLGVDGDYQVIFQTLDFNDSPRAPHAHRFHAVSLSGGEAFWSVVDPHNSAKETSSLVRREGFWAMGKTLKFTVPAAFLTDWNADSGARQICVQTQLSVEGGNRFLEKGGCVSLTTPGYKTRRATIADAFSLGTHTIDLSFDLAHDDAARAEEILQLSASAIKQFEVALGRPLLDRSDWPLILTYMPAATTSASASPEVGAYVAIDPAYDDNTIDYLIVEQLARLSVADLLTRLGDENFWLQEAYVQWLVSTTMSRMFPTRDVHAFHAARISDFKCYIDGNPACSGYFDGDGPLAQWNAQTLASTGSVRALMFVLELDALIGSEAVAKSFSTFANHLPSSEEFKEIVAGTAPAKAAAVSDMWNTWIDGSGNAAQDRSRVRATVDDNDHDGLFVFEETKLGLLDSHTDHYLDP